MTTTHTINTTGGRRVSFCQFGEMDGRPVLFCQGTPSSRLMHPSEAITRDLGARLLVIDRPGFGLTDPQAGRTLLDFAGDAAAVLDHAGIDRCAVAAISGGGPYALAFGHERSDRVDAIALAACTGPLDDMRVLAGASWKRRAGYRIARHGGPAIMELAIRLTDGRETDSAKFLTRYTRHNLGSDQEILARPEVREMYLRNFAEAFRQGLRPFAEEVCLASRPWGFDLAQIRCPVDIWHGTEDTSTPLAMGRAMADRLTDCMLHILEGQGHLFAYGPLWRDVLSRLLVRAGERERG